MNHYHYQKESLAWAGVVLFVGASSVFVANSEAVSESLAITGILAALVLIVSYTRQQFNLREYAARSVQTYERLIVEIISRDSKTLRLLEKEFRPRDAPEGPPKPFFSMRLVFPRRLDDDDVTNQFNRPKVVVRKMEQLRAFTDETRKMKLQGAGSRILRLEVLAYLVLGLTAAVAVIVVLLPEG